MSQSTYTAQVRTLPPGVLTPQEQRSIDTYKSFFGNRAEGYIENYLNDIGAYNRTPPPGTVTEPPVGSPTVNPITNPDGSTTNIVTSASTTPTAISQFDQLLSNLASGGTAEMKRISAAREEEIEKARAQQGAYSKESAAVDAQALMQKAINDALRTAAPRITAYAEGAGTSKASLSALQTQEAATRGAIEGASQASQLTTAYGQIYNQLAGVLEGLTRQDPNSPAALLANAITGSKGLLNTAVVNTPAARQIQQEQSSSNANTNRSPVATPTPFKDPYAGAFDPYTSSYGIGEPYYLAPGERTDRGSGRPSNIVISRNEEQSTQNQQYDSSSSAAFDDQGYVGESAYDAAFDGE